MHVHDSTCVVFIRWGGPGVLSTLTSFSHIPDQCISMGCGHIMSMRFSAPLLDAMLVQTLEIATGFLCSAYPWNGLICTGVMHHVHPGFLTPYFLSFNLALFCICFFKTFNHHNHPSIIEDLLRGPPCPSTRHHASCACCQSHQWPIKSLSKDSCSGQFGGRKHVRFLVRDLGLTQENYGKWPE